MEVHKNDEKKKKNFKMPMVLWNHTSSSKISNSSKRLAFNGFKLLYLIASVSIENVPISLRSASNGVILLVFGRSCFFGVNATYMWNTTVLHNIIMTLYVCMIGSNYFIYVYMYYGVR